MTNVRRFSPPPEQDRRARRSRNRDSEVAEETAGVLPRASLRQLPGPASNERLLAMQRLSGNRAVSRILAAGGTTAGRSAPIAEPLTIRRAIGFEFEDGSWKPWERTTAQEYAGVPAVPNAPRDHVRGVPRQRRLHRGTGWEMQADDTPQNGSSSMEAVTDPFPETDAGRDQLLTAMLELRQTYTVLDGLTGKPGPAAVGGGPIGPLGNYRIPGEHPFGGGPGVGRFDLFMSGGSRGGGIKMQATTGIPISQIAQQFRMFGLDQAGVAAGNPDTHRPLRSIYRGGEQGAQDHPAIRLLGGVPAIGEAAAQAMAASPALAPAQQLLFHGGPEAPKMVGFMTTLALILKALNMPKGESAKYRMPMLLRNRISAVYQLLHPNQRAVLAANPALFSAAMLNALNGVNLYPANLAGIEARAAGDPLLRAQRNRDAQQNIVANPDHVRLGTYTVGLFLARAAAGADDLTPTAIDAWMQVNVPAATPPERQGSADAFESLGAWGTDGNRVLFENRDFAPEGDGVEINIDRAIQSALAYFMYVKRHT